MSLESGTHDLVRYALANVSLVRKWLQAGRDRWQNEHLLEALEAQRAEVLSQAENLNQRGTTPPDLVIALRYGLRAWERQLLWLAVSPNLDPSLREEIARFNDNVLQTQIDISLCQALLGRGDPGLALEVRSTLQPGGNLARAGLLELLPPQGRSRSGFLSMELSPADDLVSAFYGLRALSTALGEFAQLIEPSIGFLDLPEPQRGHLNEVLRALEGFFALPPLHSGDAGLGIPKGMSILIHSAHGSGRSVALRALAGGLGRRIIEVNGEALSRLPLERARKILARLAREAEVHGELVVIEDARRLIEPESPFALPISNALSRRHAAFVFLQEDGSALDATLERTLLLRHAFSTSGSAAATREIWRRTLGEEETPSEIEEVSKRWSLSPLQARKAAHLHHLWSVAPSASADKLTAERAAQMQVPFEAGSFAVLTHPSVTFEDLILNEETSAQIRAICDAVQKRDKVLREWKLARRIRRGLGITCLFDGEPGTGKTLSAEVIAASLGFGLLRINISTIVDKYIGETEKNLHRIFESARPDTSILLFDEADSIFAKRTEVQHSNDRYSNMNVNVLLQLIEAYEGVAILTTNLKQNMDEAFERRIMFKVHFELPEEEERAAIWQRLLPPYIPMSEELDLEALGEIELSGGEIKNTIVKSAYAAARKNRLLDNEILIDTAYSEARAAGRLIREDLGNHFD